VFAQAEWIVRDCWPHISTLVRRLQTMESLSFDEVREFLRPGEPKGMTSPYS
jgi:hypothetical protein